jgi:hypothetical protein
MPDRTTPPDFEDVCQRQEFAPLVKLALSVAVWIKGIVRGTHIRTGSPARSKPGRNPARAERS